MQIAVPVENGRLSAHFGHCEAFAIVTADETTRKIVSTRQIPAPPHQPGFLPGWLHDQEADVILAGGMGGRAQQLFSERGIQVVIGAPTETAEALATAYLEGRLVAGANPCDHHAGGGHGHRCGH
ncbi:MAG: ATPase [bacterium]|nr:ATPase [bacterium]